jgi:hypothetical protein
MSQNCHTLPLTKKVSDSVFDVANVVWCTGFRTDFGWVDLPVFDEAGNPRHVRGVVESEPGLYFLGLVFLYSFSSDVLPGRGRDAAYIAKHIASQSRKRVKRPEGALAAALDEQRVLAESFPTFVRSVGCRGQPGCSSMNCLDCCRVRSYLGGI